MKLIYLSLNRPTILKVGLKRMVSIKMKVNGGGGIAQPPYGSGPSRASDAVQTHILIMRFEDENSENYVQVSSRGCCRTLCSLPL